jgi:hypothetical protein
VVGALASTTGSASPPTKIPTANAIHFLTAVSFAPVVVANARSCRNNTLLAVSCRRSSDLRYRRRGFGDRDMSHPDRGRRVHPLEKAPSPLALIPARLTSVTLVPHVMAGPPPSQGQAMTGKKERRAPMLKRAGIK